MEQFRRFRARPGNPRPLGEDLQQFGEVIRTQHHTPEDQVRVALSAIQQFVDWWQHRKAAAPSGSRQIRECRQERPVGTADPSAPEPATLLSRVRAEIRIRHYSYRTEQTYLHWISRYLQFLGSRDPVTCVSTGFRAFLEFLAVRRHVSAGTQNQAFNALLFLYREVLNIEIGSAHRTRTESSRHRPETPLRVSVQPSGWAASTL